EVAGVGALRHRGRRGAHPRHPGSRDRLPAGARGIRLRRRSHQGRAADVVRGALRRGLRRPVLGHQSDGAEHGGGSLLDFAASLKRERPPGTRQHYVSVDTQVLGHILVRATGQDLSTYASEKLWKPLGMEFDAIWLVDGTGMEWACGGLNASLRDLARFGWR